MYEFVRIFIRASLETHKSYCTRFTSILLLKQVKDLAVEITGKEDKEEAVEELKKKLKSDEFYMNDDGSIPESESDDDAHDLCDDEEGEYQTNPLQ